MARLPLLVLVALAGATACADDQSTSPSDGSGEARLAVSAAFFPLAEIARVVGGADVDVDTLVEPGQEAHDADLTPRQAASLADADVVFYLHGFQPALDSTLEQIDGPTLVDLGEGLLAGDDPHIWLDPILMATMTERAAEALSEAAPQHSASFAGRAAAFGDELAALDQRFTTGLAECATDHVVSSHDALGYLTRRYGLTAVPIAGLNPQAEPTPAELEEVAAVAQASGVRTVFFEEQLPADLARTVADEIGVATASIDTAESPSQDDLDDGISYIAIMDADLAALRAGLGCR